ncbi:hypothetical protein Sp245p_22200 (plasmid) [Azospirillum baldaniorum]|uniref:Uncharacterized protein n=1 Tax=Azospirillum baldaniorum TaxID=1064539 RepID=A0A9P1NPM1_9PROT|nr:hypothetical protein Sp245p_22200 [Azospirillum baldaniorum]CCD01017.1 protein of unknown function [Azospirillum baldaniorum]
MFNRRSVMSQIAIYCHDATKMALLQSWPAGGGMAGRWREAPQGLLRMPIKTSTDSCIINDLSLWRRGYDPRS